MLEFQLQARLLYRLQSWVLFLSDNKEALSWETPVSIAPGSSFW